MVLNGSCLCGAVQFEVTADPVLTAICHCTDCQHEGGSYSTDAVFPPGSLKYTAGEPTRFDHPGASGKMVSSYFCGKCGSTLVVMQQVLVPLLPLPRPAPFPGGLHTWRGGDVRYAHGDCDVWTVLMVGWIDYCACGEFLGERK